MTKSAINCGLVTFTEEILKGKLHFLWSDPLMHHAPKQSDTLHKSYRIWDAMHERINYVWRNRSSRSYVFFKIDAFKNPTNFTGKHLCWGLFLIKFQGLRLALLLTKYSNTFIYRTPPVAASKENEIVTEQEWFLFRFIRLIFI